MEDGAIGRMEAAAAEAYEKAFDTHLSEIFDRLTRIESALVVLTTDRKAVAAELLKANPEK